MKTLRFATWIVVTALLLSACGAETTHSTTPLRIAVTLWPGAYPAIIAQEQGFFAKHNVQVQVTYYEDYPQTYADLASNKLDGLDAVVGDAMLISEDVKLKFIFPTDYSDGADQFVVTGDIQSGADLRGKRIGVNFGTYGDLFVRELLKKNGLTVADVTLVNVAVENAASVFPSQVDAIHVYDPYTADILKNGAHVLYTTSDTPGLVLGVMAFPAALVAERPKDIQAFTDAWFEAVDWIHANQDGAVETIAGFMGVPADYVWFDGDPILTRAEAQAFMQPGNDASSAYFVTQEYIDFLSTAGILTKVVTPEDLIAPSFINK